MPTVRVTCPECDFSFSIADSRVGGLIACRDCKSEFRVEFAEDEEQPPPPPTAPTADAPTDDRPSRRPPAPRTRSRVDADHEPDDWKTDLPLRSPVPLLLILVGLQVLAAGFLVVNWVVPFGSLGSTPTSSYYYSPSTYPTAPKSTTTGVIPGRR